MTLSRSTDIDVCSFEYCFKQPFIKSASPNPFPLTGTLILKGSDFSTSFDVFSIVLIFPQVIVSSYTHDEIILQIPYICNISTTIFQTFLIIANQSSNVYELNFGPPSVKYHPVPLSPSGETIRINGTNFSKLFNCFDTASIEFSVSSATFEISTTDTMEVTTGELFGITEFVIVVEYFVDFNF
ncbi:hypothetical protein GEMRC1_011421 [Eukaryota sp. GEM-RC1]